MSWKKDMSYDVLIDRKCVIPFDNSAISNIFIDMLSQRLLFCSFIDNDLLHLEPLPKSLFII